MQGTLQSMRAAIPQEHATEGLGLAESLGLMDYRQFSGIVRGFLAADHLSRIQSAGQSA